MNLRELLILKAAGGGASLIEKTATGNPASFTTQVAKALKSLLIPLTCSQEGSGDPSPDNIRPITGLTGVNIYRTGKNLFDKTTTVYNYLISSDVITDSAVGRTVFIECKPNTTYTVSKLATKRSVIAYAKTTGIPFNGDTIYGKKDFRDKTEETITTGDDAKWLVIYLTNTNYDANVSDIINSVQLELGSTATAYEPYSGTTIPVSWQSEAGTVYGGSLDLFSGVLTLTHKMQTITGEEQVTYTVYNTTIYSGSDVFLSDSKHGQYIYGYCSMAATGANNGLIDASVLRKAYDNRGIQFYKATEYWGLESVSQSALEAKLQGWNANGTPLQVVYELATPITVQLTPNQINAIKGNNTVWTDTTGDLTIKYLDKA